MRTLIRLIAVAFAAATISLGLVSTVQARPDIPTLCELSGNMDCH